MDGLLESDFLRRYRNSEKGRTSDLNDSCSSQAMATPAGSLWLAESGCWVLASARLFVMLQLSTAMRRCR